MNWIDIVCLMIILMYVALGFKRGVIKSGVQLIGTLAVLVLSFTFKGLLANFLMKMLPFFNFSGIFNGITAMNILIYELISFVLLFVLFYCILNIIVSISGIIETILKFTVVLAIPSKILGALLGLIEGIVMAFLVAFVMLHLAPTEKKVMDSEIAIVILERTPIIGQIASNTTLALEDINNILKDVTEEEDRDSANFKVLHTLIYYNVISQEDAQKLIDDKKLVFKNTIIL